VYKTALAFAVAKASAARFVDIFYVALTNLAHRNPPGVNFIHATCDLLLLGLSIPS
jgi:hypothetical protein